MAEFATAERRLEGLQTADRDVGTRCFVAFCPKPFLMVVVALCVSAPSLAVAERLDEMSLDRWKKLREVERLSLIHI